jgi:hypothetical protein
MERTSDEQNRKEPDATACGKYGSFETLRNSKHDGAPDGT